MRKTVLALLLAASGVSAHAALNTGDIAFTSFNADEDGLSFVAFTSIAANTKIFFTDNSWNGSAIGSGGGFTAGESYNQWISGTSSIAAGTVIRFSSYDTAALMSASVGTLSRVSVSGNSNWGISATADTIYAYTGNSANAPSTFLSAITNGTFAANGPLGNTGLSTGVNAITLPASSDFYQYGGARAGAQNLADYKALVANVANWTGHDGGGNPDFSGTAPNITAFTVTAVPEPNNYAMLLAGLGLIGFIARRRNVS